MRPLVLTARFLDIIQPWHYTQRTDMATVTHIPIELYLRTVYEPDAELVNGEIEERNVGEYLHNLVQMTILFWFVKHGKDWGVRAIQEQRTRFPWDNVRIPDVCVWPRSTPEEQVFTIPQLIAIEVISPDDRQSKMQEKIEDYRRFGVAHIWYVDPVKRIGWDCSSGNWIQTGTFTVPETPIYLDMTTLFSEVDEARS